VKTCNGAHRGSGGAFRLPILLDRLTPFAWLVAGLTILGFGLRLATFDQSLFGDELSTYWIVHDQSLGDVLSSVRSNDEITPPLYFVLGWFTLEIGGDPEWVRLPSLIAGTATIPLVYLVAVRTLDRTAGAIAAAVIALSPFMIYYSVEARAYAVMIALLTLSTLALLHAVSSGRTRWWVVYAICACGALYSHYTSVFVLAAQFLWVVWKHREALRACIVANVAAAIGFAPWLPGFVADNDSPTTEILDSLQPFDFGAVSDAIENWAVGYPYIPGSVLPGTVARVMIVAGVVLAVAACTPQLWRFIERHGAAAVRRIPAGAALVALLALSTLVGEAIFSAVGTNLLGARNLNASWPGLALAIGGIVAAAGVPLMILSGALVLGGYASGAVQTQGDEAARADYAGVAKAIEERWGDADVVVDGVAFTPVPQTGLDVYLPQTHPEVRLGLPITDRPFLPFDPVPPLDEQIDQAISLGRSGSIFVVAYELQPAGYRGESNISEILRNQRRGAGALLQALPDRFEVEQATPVFDSIMPLVLFEITDRGSA
jgi:Dolichyl-phosphate-mannose-protein mannosyltransferase